MTRVISMDLARCTFCRACEVACEREHGGHSNMFVQRIDEDYAAGYAIPMNCRHCPDSPCSVVCPAKAIQRETEDAVTIAPMKCIGCGLCALACPFGAIQLDLDHRVAQKCDLCIGRTQAGQDPACVATCSARALAFGPFDDLVASAKKKNRRTIISRVIGPVGAVVILPPRHSVLEPPGSQQTA